MFSQSELAAYLDESLPVETMAAIENELRANPGLAKRLAETAVRRDSGVHSLGEIWRRCRVSCPSREQLGSHLLGVLPDEESDYITFHIEEIGCRYCSANLDDLRRLQAEAGDQTAARRRRYFQSSAGRLHSARS